MASFIQRRLSLSIEKTFIERIGSMVLYVFKRGSFEENFFMGGLKRRELVLTCSPPPVPRATARATESRRG